jgi:nucleoside-diphosphate-sugar epimerase
VFHCGALVSDWATAKEIRRINVEGTRNLLEASMASGVERFIHFSTTDVYGYPGGVAIEETYSATRFRNWYAETKLAAEAEVLRAAAARAVDVVILRPATVYGPRSKEVVGEIARAIRNRSMLLIDGGRAVAGLCYVENLVDAALLALSHKNASGEAFNVSDGLGVTWKQFTDDIARGLGCAPPRVSMPYWIAHALGFSLEHGYRLLRTVAGLSTPPLLSRQAVQIMGSNQDFSTRKAREMLGWEPRVDYETGLRATMEWLQAQRLSHA